MSLTKRIGLGITLGVDITGATTFVALGSIVDGFTTDAKAKDVDTSLLVDEFDSFLKGSIDGGTMNLTIAYSPEDTNTTKILGALFYATTQTLANWQITYPAVGGGSSAAETFLGYVNAIGREVKRDGFLTAKVGIKVSGDPGISHT